MLIQAREIPIDPSMVSLWVPKGDARDLIRGNHGKVIGANPNVPTIAPPIKQISDCDTLTDWTGTDLSIDEADKKEGTGSLKDDIASPEASTTYKTIYDSAGTWDWSDKEYILFWFYCDRASTAFTSPILALFEGSRYRCWTLTFSAGVWTAFKFPLSTGSYQSVTPPNFTLLDSLRLQFPVVDTTPFYVKIDDVRVTGKPSLINTAVGWVFDGTDDYIDCGNDKSLALTRWTMGAWIYRKVDSGTHERLISKSDSTTFDYLFQITDLDVLKAQFTDTTPAVHYVETIETMPLCEWEFIIATFDGTYIKIYINTDLKATSDDFSAFTPRTSTIPLWIGRLTNYYDFNGNIALPFVANEAWSVKQIKNFYLATKHMFSPKG